MPMSAIITLVVAVTAVDLFIVGALFANLRSSFWRPLEESFPPRVPAASAVRKRFQSISVGLFNLGWCVHLAADDDCLHVQPTAVLRWLRLGAFSVPWEAITPVRNKHGRVNALRVLNATIKAPAWVMSLADPEPAGDSSR
jgi:hypothetical protein